MSDPAVHAALHEGQGWEEATDAGAGFKSFKEQRSADLGRSSTARRVCRVASSGLG